MVWQYTGNGVVSMAAAVIATMLTVVFWRKRPTPGALSIALAMLMVTIWSAAYAFELWSADLQSKLFWTAIQYPAIVSIPWLWLAFTLEYTGRARWITVRNVLLAAAVPAVTVLLVWTGSTLMYGTVGVKTVDGVAVWAASRGPWWWTNVLYAYIPLIAATFLTWQAFVQSPRLFRGQVATVLVGALAPWLGNVLYVSGLSPVQHVDLTPLAFTFTGVAVFLGYFRFHLLDITPVPRDAILDATSDGMIVLDAQNRIVYVNKPAQKIVGRPDSQTMGMAAGQALADRLGLVGSFQSESETGAEVVLDQAGGPRHYDLRVSPLRTNRGRLTGRLATLRDITDRKLMERALRESEGRYRGLVESQSELIVRVDPEGRFTFVNDAYCRAFGKAREQLLGQTFMPLVHEEDLPHTLAAMEQLKQPPYRASMEQRALTASGWRWLAWEDYALRDEQGRVVEIQGVARDITESRRAEEERQRLEAQILHTQKLESLGVLAGGIAHDFNNLLVGILGHADLMMTSLEPDSPAQEDVRQIELAARRAADLTRQMLAYSGKGRFVVEPVDVSALVEEIAHLLDVSVSKNALLEYHFARDLPAVEGDPDQIRQVVMNLIINASEAIGDANGQIRVTTDVATTTAEYLSQTYFDDGLPGGDYVFVEIADTGCGMDEEMKARMFDPFFSTKFTGRGLGLAAVLGIVRGHRGTIHVNTEPGRGTTFRVLFPASARTADIICAPEPVDCGRGDGTILVVDDDENVRMVAERMLRRAGYEVLTASDGREGIRMVQERGGEISAVLLDTTMPNMNGQQAFLEMRSIRPDIRVLVMSGYSEQEVTRRFKDTDLVAGFLQKPWGSTALLAKLTEVMHGGPDLDSSRPSPS